MAAAVATSLNREINRNLKIGWPNSFTRNFRKWIIQKISESINFDDQSALKKTFSTANFIDKDKKRVVKNLLKISLWKTSPNRSDLESITASLNIDGLIEPDLKKRPIRDKEKYWVLTEYGLAVYKQNRKKE